MHDIEALCKRVFVIHAGKSLYDGNFKELINRVNPRRKLQFEFSDVPNSGLIDSLAKEFQFNFQDNFLTAELPDSELTRLVTKLFKLSSPASITLEDLPVEDTMRSFFANPEQFLK